MLRPTHRRPPPTAFLVGLAVYFACLAWMPGILDRLDPLTGDEPFYVMTAISLVEDHDLDETNNYAQRDYARFYPLPTAGFNGWPSVPDPLPPHASQVERPGLYSKHGLGMALLVALPFAAAGRPLVLVLLAIIAAGVAANATLLAERYTGSRWLAAAIGLVLALTPPLATFSLLIFPEMTAALGVTYATRRLLAPRNTVWQWLAVGGCAAALPWLHYRLAPICVVLALLAVIRHRKTFTRWGIVAALALPVPSAAILAAWYTYLYDRLLPPSADHAGFSDFVGTLNGLAGIFFDQQWGAVIHNPLILLAVATFVPFALKRRGDAATLAAVILPYLVLIANYRVWWGEWNPPARYLTDIVPLLAAPLAWWLGQLRPRLRWAVLAAFLLPALLVMATFVDDPQRMYNHPDGTSHLFETWDRWTGLPFTDAVPSYVFHNPDVSSVASRVVASTIGLLLLAVVTWLACRAIERSVAPPAAVGDAAIP